MREVARTGWAVHARITIDAPAEEVLASNNPAVGTVEALVDGRSVLVTGGGSVEIVAVWIGMLGIDFHVTEPERLPVVGLLRRERAAPERFRGRKHVEQPVLAVGHHHANHTPWLRVSASVTRRM